MIAVLIKDNGLAFSATCDTLDLPRIKIQIACPFLHSLAKSDDIVILLEKTMSKIIQTNVAHVPLQPRCWHSRYRTLSGFGWTRNPKRMRH